MPTLSPQNTLIVIALEAESQHLFSSFSTLYCGVGKVNAAYKLSSQLKDWQNKTGQFPQLVLNVGSAGSAHFNAGQTVNCTQFVQRDFDVTALGFAPYATPFDTFPSILTNGLRFSHLPEAICGTGDNFMTAGEHKAWNVVDMEAYALAKVCQYENIPFGCIKYITDGANGHAAQSWEEGLPATAKSLYEAVSKISSI